MMYRRESENTNLSAMSDTRCLIWVFCLLPAPLDMKCLIGVLCPLSSEFHP